MEEAATETREPVRMARWIKVCRPEDIPELGARVIRRTGGDIAVFRNSEGECFALLDRCPHTKTAAPKRRTPAARARFR